jgi:hypothetical protein
LKRPSEMLFYSSGLVAVPLSVVSPGLGRNLRGLTAWGGVVRQVMMPPDESDTLSMALKAAGGAALVAAGGSMSELLDLDGGASSSSAAAAAAAATAASASPGSLTHPEWTTNRLALKALSCVAAGRVGAYGIHRLMSEEDAENTKKLKALEKQVRSVRVCLSRHGRVYVRRGMTRLGWLSGVDVKSHLWWKPLDKTTPFVGWALSIAWASALDELGVLVALRWIPRRHPRLDRVIDLLAESPVKCNVRRRDSGTTVDWCAAGGEVAYGHHRQLHHHGVLRLLRRHRAGGARAGHHTDGLPVHLAA